MDHHGRQTLTSQDRLTSLLAGSCIPQFHMHLARLPHSLQGSPAMRLSSPETGESLDASWCRPEPVTRLRS